MSASRRTFLTGMLGTAATACFGQGVSTHQSTALPRGKPSGLPFNAKFTDVGAQAGLRAVTTYGPADHKNYIVETLGCGCAFLDYDNDGWLDVLVLGGTLLGETAEIATNRLFKNNRNGTFNPQRRLHTPIPSCAVPTCL